MPQTTLIKNNTPTFGIYKPKVDTTPTASDYKNFECLYDEHSPKNFAYIIKHTDTKPEAEKVLMNVYFKIWANIKGFEDNLNAENKIIAVVLSEVKAYNQKKNSDSISDSKLFQWAYHTFIAAAVIYLFFIK